MLLPNRHGSSESYRYGFNGKEKDDEVKGEGNSYDFENRFYDNRVAKFLSIDPLFKEISYESNYAFAGNRPVDHIDFAGLHKYPKGKKGAKQTEDFPAITKYLSTMLQDDIKKALIIKNTLSLMSTPETAPWKPDAEPILDVQTIEDRYGWGNGPLVLFVDAPGGVQGSNGKFKDVEGWDVEEPTIELNIRIAQFVEDKLTDDDPSNDKYALFILVSKLNHETAHYVDYENGTQNQKDFNDRKFGDTEIGYALEGIIYFSNEINDEAGKRGDKISPAYFDNTWGMTTDEEGNVIIDPEVMKKIKLIVDELEKNIERAQSVPTPVSNQ